MASEFNPGILCGLAFNAITQVETSTRGTTAAKGRAQFARGTFGAGAVISKKAFAIARDLVHCVIVIQLGARNYNWEHVIVFPVC